MPPFLVQLLVENAVKYGVAPYEEGGDIALRLAVEDNALVVEVTNRGQIAPRPGTRSTGLGLANLRSRLALLFGPAASLTLADAGPDLVRARALVPARRATAATISS
ncbi:MAG TPA: hypothetical protein VK178_10815 [Opitutaceae bacterium]|nr:hypothetical protein [Opitutaceae bacterium]